MRHRTRHDFVTAATQRGTRPVTLAPEVAWCGDHAAVLPHPRRSRMRFTLRNVALTFVALPYLAACSPTDLAPAATEPAFDRTAARSAPLSQEDDDDASDERGE